MGTSDQQPDSNPDVKKVQVDTTKITKGTIKYFGNPNLQTPTILARCTKALRYFCVGLMTMVSGTDFFSGGESKKINFCLGAFILFLGGVDIMVGVEPEDKRSITTILLIGTIYYLFHSTGML